jgi:hypothetical protein
MRTGSFCSAGRLTGLSGGRTRQSCSFIGHGYFSIVFVVDFLIVDWGCSGFSAGFCRGINSGGGLGGFVVITLTVEWSKAEVGDITRESNKCTSIPWTSVPWTPSPSKDGDSNDLVGDDGNKGENLFSLSNDAPRMPEALLSKIILGISKQ